MPHASLPSLDRFMLRRLAMVQAEVTAAYRAHQFSRVYAVLQRFVAVECSNFYLDIAKDRCGREARMGVRMYVCVRACVRACVCACMHACTCRLRLGCRWQCSAAASSAGPPTAPALWCVQPPSPPLCIGVPTPAGLPLP